MNNKNKIMNCKGSQKGIALLFSLAILALLLVMAMGFATNAIFDQRTAYNSANVASARILAQAELNKVLTLLKYYDSGIYYSHSINNAMICDSTPTSDMLEKLQTKEGNSYIFQWKNGYDSYINWNYVAVNDGTADRIIGRTAFILIPDEGVDPGTLVNKDQDESLNTEEIRIGANVYEINVRSMDPSITQPIATVFNYTRPPYTPVANPGQYNGNWIDFPTMFNYFTIAGQPLSPAMKDNFRRWFVIDVPNDKEAFWIDLNNDKVMDKDSTHAMFELYHRFYLPQTAAFWNGADIDKDILLDNNKDGVPDIPLVKWTLAGPVTTPGGIPWLATFGMKDSGPPQVEIPIGSGLLYNKWIDDDATYKGTYASAWARRRQIAANLVEYCKSPIAGIPADSAISDQANWLPPNPAPTFTGNKKTPYIDEIGVALEASAVYTKKTVSTTDDTYNVTVSLNGYLLGKLIDIYSTTPWAQPFTLKVRGSISYKVTVDGNNLATVVNQPFEFDLPSTLIYYWDAGYGTHVYTFNAATLPASLTSPDITIATTPNPVTVVNGVSVHIDKAILYDTTGGFKGYDYSTINKTSTLAVDLLNCDPTTIPALPQSTFFSFQTEDPRQNLNDGDWYVATAAPQVYNAAVSIGVGTSYWRVKWDNPSGSGYTGIVNEKGSPMAAHTADPFNTDLETATDPAGGTLSTAFIRNAPMLSPWEIGFIHRGQKWQTINLKKYDKTRATKAVADSSGTNIYMAGAGLYTDGDANILDQIKMTDQTTSPKKINIKTHLDEVLKALLNKVRIGCTPDPNSVPIMDLNSMAAVGGLPIDTSSTKVDVLIGKIKEKNINFFTRAGIADVAEYALGSTDLAPLDVASRNTDAKQEELIGKTVNLCEVGGQIEFFTIIVLAQTIRDVGTNGGAGITIAKVDRDGNKQSMVSVKLGVFDYKKIGTYVEDGITKQSCVYADEIIGEQKIRVRGYRDASGNCQILSYEYVE